MSNKVRPMTLGRWLRRHSLTLVAALGGATGVAYAAGVHAKSPAPATGVDPYAFAMAIAANLPAPPPAVEPAQPTPTPAVLPRDNVQDVVQIALVLDTSSSMDGLINQARSHLWTMVDQMGKLTRVVDGKLRGVRVELALFEYGNTSIPEKQGYIRRVLPLTTDLDGVSEKLHALYTNGGDEYAGQAIVKAVSSLEWSNDPNAMKFIFVAGNESFDQGPIDAARAMKAAAGHDIHVQLIHCGTDDPTWQAAAKLAKSDLVNIDQNRVAAYIPSPQDAEILRLGNQLNGTYLAYGAHGKGSSDRQSAMDLASANLSTKVALERAQLKSKASYDNAGWDVVDAMTNDRNFLANTSDDQLPEEMRGKTIAEKQAIVAKKEQERNAIKAQIAKLEAERTKFLEAERAKLATGEETSLETELMKTTKKIAGQKGYRF